MCHSIIGMGGRKFRLGRHRKNEERKLEPIPWQSLPVPSLSVSIPLVLTRRTMESECSMLPQLNELIFSVSRAQFTESSMETLWQTAETLLSRAGIPDRRGHVVRVSGWLTIERVHPRSLWMHPQLTQSEW